MSRAVIDQPGFRVFTIGLIVSLALGYALKSLISSDRVDRSLQRSVQVLEKDFSIDFESAEVKLTKWGLPLPSVVIYKIRISPKKLTCQNSQIYIDQLEIPLSFESLFFVKPQIDAVRAQNVEIRLSDLGKCFNEKIKNNHNPLPVSGPESEETSKIASGEIANPIISQQNSATSVFLQKSNSTLKEISIEQIKIINQKTIEQPLLLKQVHFNLNYENFRLNRVDLKSRLLALKDNRTDIYFLVSDLSASLRQDQNKSIELALNVKGRILDGDVQVFLNSSSLSKKVTFEVATKKVSLKAFSSLSTQRDADALIEKWPMNLSFIMLGEADFANESQFTMKFKNVEAQGESMAVSSSEIEVENKNNHIEVKPFELEARNVSLNPLKAILKDKLDFQSMENLGEFIGTFKFESKSQWELNGAIENSQLIFANRGSRELQTIESVRLKLLQKNKFYQLKLDQFKMNAADMLGELEASYDRNDDLWLAKLNLEGPLFNERVWKQLTQVPQKPSIRLNWSYKKAVDERHQLKLNTQQLQFPGVNLMDMQIDFLQLAEGSIKSMALSMKSPKAQIKVPELKGSLAKSFFNADTNLNESQYLAVKSQISLQGADWKSMSFDFDSNLLNEEGTKQVEHFKARGEWKPNGALMATAQLQNPQRQFRYKVIKNENDEIAFVPEKKE
jgi:hypothetical protein